MEIVTYTFALHEIQRKMAVAHGSAVFAHIKLNCDVTKQKYCQICSLYLSWGKAAKRWKLWLQRCPSYLIQM